MRHLTPEDAEAIRKVMFGWKKHLKTKNQTLSAVELELKNVTEVVRRDPTLRVFVKRIAMSVSLDSIKVIYFYLILAFFIFNSKFFYLGQIQHVREMLDVEENVTPGLSRSEFVTYYEREAVARALNVILFIFVIFYFFN